MKLKEEEHIKWAVREVAAAAKTGRNVAVSFFFKKKRLNDDHRVLFSLIYRHTYIQVYTTIIGRESDENSLTHRNFLSKSGPAFNGRKKPPNSKGKKTKIFFKKYNLEK